MEMREVDLHSMIESCHHHPILLRTMLTHYHFKFDGSKANRQMPSYAKHIIESYDKNGEVDQILSQE
jgi:hypothetical protein